MENKPREIYDFVQILSLGAADDQRADNNNRQTILSCENKTHHSTQSNQTTDQKLFLGFVSRVISTSFVRARGSNVPGTLWRTNTKNRWTYPCNLQDATAHDTEVRRTETNLENTTLRNRAVVHYSNV